MTMTDEELNVHADRITKLMLDAVKDDPVLDTSTTGYPILMGAAVEFLRYAVATWKDMDEFDACPNVVDRFYEVANGKLAPLNLSGTQIGAAIRLALNLFKFGPRDCFNDPDIADRIIRISKNFPRLD